MMAVMGIDPGVSGGLAVLRADGTTEYVRAFNPEMTEEDLVTAIRCGIGALYVNDSQMVFMEKVGYKAGDGGKGSFTFGRVVGLIRGALLAQNYKPIDVYPMLWQGTMGCLSGGNKNVTKRKAMELFPGEKITHAVADALLIAEYGRRRLLL